jgi:elongation factor P
LISTSDFRTGLTIELDDDAYQVVDFQHVKPGKGAAFVRAKVKNIKTGQVLEKTFRAGEKMPAARIDRKDMEYLYEDGLFYHFMDSETYEQTAIDKEIVEEIVPYLKENMEVQISFYGREVVSVDLPNTVDLKVVQTSPDVRGDTASGGGKPATLETGAVINVPFFIKIGDVVKVNTGTGEYITRV